jgi:hypothetical protein
MKHGAIKNLPAKSFPVILSEASFFARERTCGVERPPNAAAFPSPPQGPITNLAAKSFPVILSDASSSLAKERAESKDPPIPQPSPHRLRDQSKIWRKCFPVILSEASFFAREETSGVEGPQHRWLPLTASGNSHRLLAASQAPDSETRRYATPSRSSSSQSASFSSSRR